MKKMGLVTRVLSVSAGFSVFAAGALALSSCASKTEAEEPEIAIPGVVLFTDGDNGGENKGLISGPEKLQGGWYTFDDKKDCGHVIAMPPEVPTGELHPDPDGFTYSTYGASPPALKPEGKQEVNTKGVHFWGTAHLATPSGGAGVGLKPPGSSWDLEKAGYTGVRFWAWSSTTLALSVKLTDDVSEPDGMVCKLNNFDTGCKTPTSTGASQGCFNAALVNVEVGPSWKEYRVYFKKTVDMKTDALVQKGPLARQAWGETADGKAIDDKAFPFRPNKVYQFQVQVDGTDAFDVWLDNVGFILPGGVQDIP